jgi:hypothetical protein
MVEILVLAILLSVLAVHYWQPRITLDTLGGAFTSSTDFLGVWYNDNQTQPSIMELEISENQGTYTITAYSERTYYQYDRWWTSISSWGTVTLQMNPPNAHAFYTFQSGGSADLKLHLLNRTSLQIEESFQYPSSTLWLITEQFWKAPTTT